MKVLCCSLEFGELLLTSSWRSESGWQNQQRSESEMGRVTPEGDGQSGGVDSGGVGSMDVSPVSQYQKVVTNVSESRSYHLVNGK